MRHRRTAAPPADQPRPSAHFVHATPDRCSDAHKSGWGGGSGRRVGHREALDGALVVRGLVEGDGDRIPPEGDGTRVLELLATCHSPGNRANTARAASVPMPPRRYFRRTKNSAMSCGGPVRTNAKPASRPDAKEERIPVRLLPVHVEVPVSVPAVVTDVGTVALREVVRVQLKQLPQCRLVVHRREVDLHGCHGRSLAKSAASAQESSRDALGLLALEQPALPVEPTAEAGERPVGADHPVARHDDRDRVLTVRRTAPRGPPRAGRPAWPARRTRSSRRRGSCAAAPTPPPGTRAVQSERQVERRARRRRSTRRAGCARVERRRRRGPSPPRRRPAGGRSAAARGCLPRRVRGAADPRGRRRSSSGCSWFHSFRCPEMGVGVARATGSSPRHVRWRPSGGRRARGPRARDARRDPWRGTRRDRRPRA